MKQIEQAWLEHQQQLLAFISKKVGHQDDAADILSDVFLQLVSQNDNKAFPEKITAWLYRVTQNKIIDYYRQKKPQAELPNDLPAKDNPVYEAEELSRCMQPMIQTLPEKYQQIIQLSEIDGKKYQDIADELNLSIPAIKSRVRRGRQQLHQSIIRCCTVYQNRSNEIIDYEPNSKTKQCP